ncbi:hypothetical protein [Microbacterium sp. SLBN-146]|uniref:hypothetical protein n=1 Tax=Microbacterium sp. SLBN-146 TaxID=2768457 RepID=UPI0011723AD0|nr:hypothetical protein [Microbacterium sp. SLBN-146]TQJ31986.1 hypothetical protein FBY39_2477 [Microbacterium sp. SLBN-146]
MSSALSRSSDPVTAAVEAGVARVVAALAEIGASNPVVLIDGRSGAGKSSLARRLVQHWPMAGRVQLVALDSLYPGWDGLELGVTVATENVLRPHARGIIGVWRRWDWDEGAVAEAHAIDPALPLIVEGSGSLNVTTARLADITVWVESPEASRKQRALARDGDTYRPHWERWARQEERHLANDSPGELAKIVVTVP